MSRANARPSALDRLDVFIGRWLNEGEAVVTPGASSVRIFASDVYQWGRVANSSCTRPMAVSENRTWAG